MFQILCVVWFFVVFGYFYGERYWEHQRVQESFEKFQNIAKQNNRAFVPEQIQNLEGNTKLYVTPDTSLLTQIVREINTAESEIFLEMYIFTEKKIRQALIQAHKRWVKVQVLLENNPYMAPYLNDTAYNELKESGVDVRWSDPLIYSLNHSKLLIIDNHAYISSWNFSYSFFTKNKDFLVKVQDEKLIFSLKKLFQLDFTHTPGWVQNEHLVVSPYMSREKLESFIKSAEKKIQFYFPYIADDDFEKLLIQKAWEWVIIKGIVEKWFYEENTEIITKLEQYNIQISPLNRYKLHAKSIIIDETYAYIWSINFSKYSFDENREIGILLTDPDIISELEKMFQNDFQK